MQAARLFHETDMNTLLACAHAHPLATIICVGANGRPIITHAPVLATAHQGKAVLRFHLAKVNNVCRALSENPNCLISFHGQGAYISPDWYEVPDQVPTWNYKTAEAEGTVTVLDTAASVRLMDDISDHFEQTLLPKPIWTRHKMSAGKFERMLMAIDCFEMIAKCFEGTSKLSQNKPIDVQNRIINKLSEISAGQIIKEMKENV